MPSPGASLERYSSAGVSNGAGVRLVAPRIAGMADTAPPLPDVESDASAETRVTADAPMTTGAPHLSIDEAANLVERLYGLIGEAHPLSSERDQNLHIKTPEDEFLLRISNAAEPAEIIDLQNRALVHIAEVDPDLPTPRLIYTRDGAEHGHVAVDARGANVVRLFTYLAGVQVRGTKRSGAQRRALGAGLARLDLALRGFEHAAAQHDLLWNIAKADRLAHLIGEISGEARRRMVRRFMDRFEREVRPRLGSLRAQVIHNDFNLYNVLVAADDAARLTGIIDFGDIVRAPLVCDVATGAAYQMVNEPDPLAAAAEFIGAYQALLPLDAAERAVLFDLIAIRHLITVLISEWRAARNPQNRSYIMRHNAEAWEALAALEAAAEDGGRERLLQPLEQGDGR